MTRWVNPTTFVRAGVGWEERSTEAGPEYLPCLDCHAEWNPVFVAWVRRHLLNCRYVADFREHD